MSFFKKNPHGTREYTMFSEGANDEYSLGYEGKPNISNIKKALDYVRKRDSHYSDVEEKLVLMLPPEEREPYISKRLKELDKYSDKELLSHLSEDGQIEYLAMRDKDLRTKLRQIIQKIEESKSMKLTQKIKSKVSAKLSPVAAAAGPSREDIEKEVRKRTKKKKKKEK